MKKMPGIILWAMAALLFTSAVHAQDGGGGTRSIFTLGAGSRAISMGGAFAAIGDDPSVLYYNPAAMKLNPYPSVMANHIQLFPGFSDASYDFIGLVYPTMSAGAFGLGFMTVGTGGIREFDSYSVETDEISYRESQAIISYAFDMPWKFLGRYTIGSSVKILNQGIGEFSDTGTGVDIGILFRQDLIKGLVLGCNLQDLAGAQTKLVSVTEKVDGTIILGAGYTRRMGNGSSLSVSVQVDMPERADNDLRFGAEYNFKRIASLRAGFDSESVTAGVGFGWNRYRGDYGFFSREEAGSSHPFSVQARIGSSIEDRIRIEEERRQAEEEKRIAEIFSARVARHIESARGYRDSGEPEKALDEIKIALEYDPGNIDASAMMTEVEKLILDLLTERTRTAEKSLLINQNFGLGLRYYSSNEYILSRAQWLAVLEIDPENQDAKDYLARTEEKLGEQIAQHRTSAIGHEKNGRFAAAISEWNIVRMIDPDNEEALESTRRISSRMEELDRNYRVADQRLKTIDSFEDALKAYSEGRYPDAVSLLQRILEQQPDHAEARDLLKRVQRKLTPLSDVEKEQIRQFYIQGMRYFTQRNYTLAIETWKKILEIDPDNESVSKNIEDARQRLEKTGSLEEE